MPAFVTKEAPDFTADAVVNSEFRTVRLSDYKGKYVVLFFYPLDFTFVCPTEIIAFSDKIDEFHKRGCEVIGVSVDSKFCHLAWIKTPRADGGLGGLRYPLVSDLTKSISADYGVLMESGVALRGTFLIDRNGVLRHILINDLPLGRNIDETIRMIDALHFFEQHGEVCPANWKPGALSIDTKNAGRYFKAAHM
ncbi:MAG: peroxiredoxin [Zavarzinella sp.]|nr:peroxiredoxin [Zavarzinella sp.]